MIQTNEHINVSTNQTYGYVEFTPDEGYAMWDDTEIGNIDEETGEPICYWLTIICPNEQSAIESAPHIWAKLIDETMEVYGKVPGQPEVATYGLRKTANDTEESHTYVDENGVVRQKKGVY